MKTLIFTLSTMSAALLIWSFGLAHAADDAKAEIDALERKLLAATTADEAISFFDEQEIVLYDYLVPLQYVGGKAVRADFDKAFGSLKNLKGDFIALEVVATGELAVAHSLQHFTWTDKDNKPGEGTFRVTNCWHKVNGQWKIFHAHVSFPIDPATGKAEMNLKE